MIRTIVTLVLLVFSYSAISAEEAPTLKLVGTWKVGLGQNAFVEDRLWVWDLAVGKGKLEFFGIGSGTPISPCGEWGEQRDSEHTRITHRSKISHSAPAERRLELGAQAEKGGVHTRWRCNT